MTVNKMEPIFTDRKPGTDYHPSVSKRQAFDGTVLTGACNAEEQKECLRETKEQVKAHETSSDYLDGLKAAMVLREPGRIRAGAVMECQAKNISYKQADRVKVCVQDGFVYKAQVDMEQQKVYVEQKNENGTVKGYEIDPLRLQEDTNDPLEQLALESFKAAKRAGQGEKTKAQQTSGITHLGEDDAQKELTLEEAMQQYYAFVEDRIKNGPPKIKTGGAEFSEDDWKRLIRKVDDNLEDVKEEQEQRIKKLLEDQEKSEEEEKTR